MIENNPSVSHETKTSLYGVITPHIHPYIQTPFLMIHPCKTPELMQMFRGNHSRVVATEGEEDSESDEPIDGDEELEEETDAHEQEPQQSAFKHPLAVPVASSTTAPSVAAPESPMGNDSHSFILWASIFLPLVGIQIPESVLSAYYHSEQS